MRKIFLCVLITIFSFKSYSQIKYEPGYYVDNSGNVVNCLIKNTDGKTIRRDLPINYLQSQTTEKERLKISPEFSVINKFRFKRYSVDIDRSTDNLNDMDYNRAPEFKK
jgi:hypothetical protein